MAPHHHKPSSYPRIARSHRVISHVELSADLRLLAIACRNWFLAPGPMHLWCHCARMSRDGPRCDNRRNYELRRNEGGVCHCEPRLLVRGGHGRSGIATSKSERVGATPTKWSNQTASFPIRISKSTKYIHRQQCSTKENERRQQHNSSLTHHPPPHQRQQQRHPSSRSRPSPTPAP